MWPVMHTAYVHAGSYMHPVHDKQETSLNVRGGGNSQTLRGQDILRSSNCTNKKAMFYNYVWAGGGSISTHTPSFLHTQIKKISLNRR